MKRLAFVLALAAVAGASAVGGAATYALVTDDGGGTRVQPSTAAAGARTARNRTAMTVGEVYRRARAGVVEVTVSADRGSGFSFGPEDSDERQAQGSGFVYDAAGHVVTNQHVVADAETVSVTAADGRTYEATVAGTDPSTDLAVLALRGATSGLKPLELGSSSALSVGDGVVAIGSPFGLEQTTTAGIVSALNRQMEAPNGFTINNSIQTDAAINHGNSGGPLLDMSGRVVGVNAQIASESRGNDGVGFAIPSETVRRIVSELLQDGRVEHAYLGVSLAEIPPSVTEELEVVAGVAVTQVRAGTPAARAGLRAASGSDSFRGQSYPTGGDVITAIDGKRITSANDVQSAITAKSPGETVSLTYSRDGERRTVDVELARRPS